MVRLFLLHDGVASLMSAILTLTRVLRVDAQQWIPWSLRRPSPVAVAEVATYSNFFAGNVERESLYFGDRTLPWPVRQVSFGLNLNET
jgi:hypothetical protein